MRHTDYALFPIETRRNHINDYATKRAAQLGRGLETPVVWFPEVIEDSERLARLRAEKLANDHRNVAVKFRNTNAAHTEDVSEAHYVYMQARIEYDKITKSATLAEHTTREYVTCSGCGSRLKVDLVQGSSCPLCSGDLLTKGARKQIETVRRRMVRAKDAYEKKLTLRNDAMIKAGQFDMTWYVLFFYES